MLDVRNRPAIEARDGTLLIQFPVNTCDHQALIEDFLAYAQGRGPGFSCSLDILSENNKLIIAIDCRRIPLEDREHLKGMLQKSLETLAADQAKTMASLRLARVGMRKLPDGTNGPLNQPMNPQRRAK